MRLYDRCMGACCEDIGLPISPEELEASYNVFMKREEATVRSGDRPDEMFNKFYSDIHLIFPMLTFKKVNYRHPESPNKKSPHKIYHYSCKHFDSVKRKCSIYEHRPKMCRTYPDKEFCNNPKCQWRKMVEGRKQCQNH